MAFWDARRGIVVGDPVEDHAEVLTTDDGGAAWQQQSPPEAIPGEGSFAASNSCLTVYGERDAWFATGGPDGARVFHSSDSGRTWSAAATPMRNDSASAGIFSLAFRDARHGIAAGGDYAKDKEARGNLALTSDGGRTWVVPKGAGPRGFRSAAAWAGGDVVIVTGSSGSEISRDGGNTWQGFDDGAYHALSFAAGTGWAVGPEGRVARYRADGK
jgi:photosystem II stability/assembly factor-like uncharacterized protein